MSVSIPFERLVSRFERALASDLPGTPAQLRLAPQPRVGWTPGELPADARHAGGLWLWFPNEAGDAACVLTRRKATLPTHAGQLSLPGGARDSGESLEACALRETREELGSDTAAARVLGALTPLYIPVSGFVLHPFVAAIDRRPRWMPAPAEVEALYEPTLEDLDDPARHGFTRRRWEDRTVVVPHVDVGGARLWGATAMIVAEGLAAIGRGHDPWDRSSNKE